LDLPQLVEKTLSINCSCFIETLKQAISLLQTQNGRVGNLTIINRLVMLEPIGEALVVGDLHGDLDSLILILQKSRFIEKMEKDKDATLIFLGDYGDRGDKSIQIYYLILKLKLSYPGQVVLLRGNHEGPKNLEASPHDLPLKFQIEFGKDWELAYDNTTELWPHLYNAVYVEDHYLMVHGGVSPRISSLQDIAQAQDNQNEALLEDLLWNDPDENQQYVSFSPRGAGHLFGKKVTEDILRRLNAKILLRGHEPSEVGFKINHDSKVLTLFSRKGAPYFNQSGAYLQLPLFQEFESAQQLIPFIHKF